MTERVPFPVLTELDRRVHRALLDAVISRGVIPSVAELALTLAASIAAIHASLDTLSGADYLARDDRGGDHRSLSLLLCADPT